MLETYLKFETLRIRLIADDPALNFLSANSEAWQITLLLYHAGPEGFEGTNSLIRNLYKKRLSDVSIFSFIKNAVEKGYFLRTGGTKKNTVRYRLSECTFNRLDAFFAMVYGTDKQDTSDTRETKSAVPGLTINKL